MTLEYLDLVYKIAYITKKMELALERESAVKAND